MTKSQKKSLHRICIVWSEAISQSVMLKEYPVENFWSIDKIKKAMYLPLIIQMLKHFSQLVRQLSPVSGPTNLDWTSRIHLEKVFVG